jgi:hypothetical protein
VTTAFLGEYPQKILQKRGVLRIEGPDLLMDTLFSTNSFLSFETCLRRGKGQKENSVRSQMGIYEFLAMRTAAFWDAKTCSWVVW